MMKKSFLFDHSYKKTRQSERFRCTARVCGRWSLPHSSWIPSTRFSFGAAASYLARRFYLSRVARARDFTTSQKVRSLFPALPNASYFPGIASFVVSFDYRHETRRLFLETSVRIFLFHPLNIHGVQVSTTSLANNRSCHFP